MSRDQSKATHYIQLLDAVRCEGQWAAVPELVRKIRKHAPGRTCLALTAESEYAVVQWLRDPLAAGRPVTASSENHHSDLEKYVEPLLAAQRAEKTHVEDEFQARICLGWIYWHIGQPAVAVYQLPENIEAEYAQLDGTNKESAGWTKVCALKASYVKGVSLQSQGDLADALATFESAIAIISSPISNVANKKELVAWTELLLTGSCMAASVALKQNVSSRSEADTLSLFRAWSKHWEDHPNSLASTQDPQAEATRREVWREYYFALSDLLQADLPYPSTSLATAYVDSATRHQQQTELRHVQAQYEALLISEVNFPEANAASTEVDAFVEIVMVNWRIMCGTWSEQDLGVPSIEVSRGVLDTLYSAASKTFHSTRVLRHLFTVHLAVGEFDLAFKAFDTYLDIVTKGKARVEKSGEPEENLDNDEVVLHTASECIKALCRNESRQGAEKAKDIAQYFEDWLNKHHPRDHQHGHSLSPDTVVFSQHIHPKSLAASWRCIGIGHAQWARLTYDAASRPELQLHAIQCFRTALQPDLQSTKSIDTIFALALVLAERRELAAAIDVIKTGLADPIDNEGPTDPEPHFVQWARERSMIPLCHLLGLLLSARQEFSIAARACEGAFEQFKDARKFYGASEIEGGFRSEHLKSNEKLSPHGTGIVDDMDDFEKENLLEAKMTQLSILEISLGPEEAVNGSEELLGLYTRLFGDPTKVEAPNLSTSLAPPPKSSAGTIRSMTGSIFRSSGRARRATLTVPAKLVSLARPPTTGTLNSAAPAIHVTNEHGVGRKSSVKSHHEKIKKRNTSSVRHSAVGSGAVGNGTGSNEHEKNLTASSTSNATDTDFFAPPKAPGVDASVRASQVGMALSPERVTFDASTKTAQPANAARAPVPRTRIPVDDMDFEDTSYLPDPHARFWSATVRFSKEQQKRRRVAILIKVWLLVAGFYRRAGMPGDANGAVLEAEKLVSGLEEEFSKTPCANGSAHGVGWEGGKSIGEQWGDVLSERGYLALDQSLPLDAMKHFEAALTRFANHPAATVGLSEILLDIYTEDLLPPASIPALIPSTPPASATASSSFLNASTPTVSQLPSSPSLPTHGPLGLAYARPAAQNKTKEAKDSNQAAALNRLAARDRAYGLLSALTKLGSGWNYGEAWMALAKAYELGGQVDKAREVLWWCVELEDSRPVRAWGECAGGYVL